MLCPFYSLLSKDRVEVCGTTVEEKEISDKGFCKKGFYLYKDSKKKGRENVSLLLNEARRPDGKGSEVLLCLSCYW